MIVDFGQLPSLALPPVLIIGSGPAALTLVSALDNRGIRSLMLEAGGDGYSQEAQNLYAGRVVGDPYFDLDLSRLMQFGGSGNHWGGRVRSLDAHDFLDREGIPHMGWPISKADLDPYQGGVDAILGVVPNSEAEVSPDMLEVQFGFSEVLHFGDRFRPLVERSDQRHLALHCRVTHLESAPERSARVHVRHTLSNATLSLEPRIVVLATGGIENSRVLLWSNEMSADPVVRESAPLGRYWMEHPHGHGADVRANDYDPRLPYEDTRVYMSPSFDALARYGTLNAALLFAPALFDEADSSFERRAKDLSCRIQESSERLDRYLNVPGTCTRPVLIGTEQAPDPENRVALSTTDVDAHGIPRTVLHWRKSELDRRTIKTALELFGRFLISSRAGILRVSDWVRNGTDNLENGQPGGQHHMGGTRMGTDPHTSVVDRNLRVHGMSNLYVAGSSVFPTGGHANPTYAIMQLSLRLADHLSSELRQ